MRDRAVVHQHLRQALIEQVAVDVKAIVQAMETVGTNIPQDVLAEYIAATFILVLNWLGRDEEPPFAARGR